MPGTTPRTTAQPDPRSPYVIDTHEFARRPGSMRTVHETVPAPEHTGEKDGVAYVPAGSDVDLDARLEAVVEGVLATGTARAAVAGECVRCLEPLDLEVEADFQDLYFFPGEDTGGDEDAVFLVNDLLDLEPVVHDAVVLALPVSPLCRDDCLGLCSECGALLNEDPEHSHETVDPRWAALADLKDPEASNSGTAPVAPPAQDQE
ncbi:DUF177 domain-containing protein [Catenulispora subtropica]|uniref:DUF177 domain-containing protein n=1 Tax=Catenulispora subtropica TaxID=450798 RepID=A0ABP5DBC5_9ACTN